MKMLIAFLAIASLFTNCVNNSESAAGPDTTVTSTTPPPTEDTNPVGIMMGDTTIGINDSLKNDSQQK